MKTAHVLFALALSASPALAQQPASAPAANPNAPPPAGQNRRVQGDMPAAPRENYAAGAQGSSNMKIKFHVPLTSATDIRVEQELGRPYVYQPHGNPAGFHIINVRDPSKAFIQYSWAIEQPDLHLGRPTGVMLFKDAGRYYAV